MRPRPYQARPEPPERSDRRRETVAAADGRDLEVEWRVARVPAVVHEIFGRLLVRADLHESFVVAVRLPEVGAQATLSFMNFLHLHLRG